MILRSEIYPAAWSLSAGQHDGAGGDRECQSGGASPSVEHQGVREPQQERDGGGHPKWRDHRGESERGARRAAEGLLVRRGVWHGLHPGGHIQWDRQTHSRQGAAGIQWNDLRVRADWYRQDLHHVGCENLTAGQRDHPEHVCTHFRIHSQSRRESEVIHLYKIHCFEETIMFLWYKIWLVRCFIYNAIYNTDDTTMG